MSVAGILLALLVGTTLGLFGGGGAVLTVPVFVYALGVPAKSAIPMSLFVVGAASSVGAAERWRRKQFSPAGGIGFGLAAMAGAFVGARIGVVVPSRVQLSLFAIAVIAAAVTMLRSANHNHERRMQLPWGLDYAAFAMVGILTGIVGIGGGFLFVPALIGLFGVPMAEATGLSMMVIAMNSIAGLAGYSGHVEIQWPLVLAFTAVVIAATLLAGRLAPRVPVATLKRTFAVMLIAIGALVLSENLR